jgi:ABC-type Fe3+/spermidine/putrescine transport system ATPase subunit
VLETVNMTGFETRRVTELSGGEQQRVALARTLAPNPRLLMFDEPLGALDRALREQLIAELRGILRHSGVPTIYVTHDQEEAFTIADRVILLHDGLIVQTGTPDEVYGHPVSGWAARFLGLGNVLAGEILDGQGGMPWRVHTDMGVFSLGCGHAHQMGEQVEVLIRPNSASLNNENSADVIQDRVADIIFYQNNFKVTLDNGLYFYFNQGASNLPKPGEEVLLKIGAVECLR